MNFFLLIENCVKGFGVLNILGRRKGECTIAKRKNSPHMGMGVAFCSMGTEVCLCVCGYNYTYMYMYMYVFVDWYVLGDS